MDQTNIQVNVPNSWRYECQDEACHAIIGLSKEMQIGYKCLCGNDTFQLLSYPATATPLNEYISPNSRTNPENSERQAKILQDAYEMILQCLDDWLILSEDAKQFIGVWVIGTYFHEDFNTYPYLFFNAMRGSGKTRLLRLIAWLGNKGDGTVQNDMKEAVLFRMQRNKVLCIDEFENVGSKEKQTLRQILNSAYKKGLKITRMKKSNKGQEEKYVAEDFEPFMPICMANIWGMDEVLGDRSITFIIEKSDDARITKKVENFERNPLIKAIRAKLNELNVVSCNVVTQKHYIEDLWNTYLNDKYNTTSIHTLHTTTYNYITTPEYDYEGNLELFNRLDAAGIDGRNFELMFPILLTAKKIGVSILEDILRISKELVSEKRSEEFTESKDVSLINFVAKQGQIDELKEVRQITLDFRAYLGDQTGEDPWLNEKWVGKALRRLCLIKYKKRFTSGIKVILDVEKAKLKSTMFKHKDGDNEA